MKRILITSTDLMMIQFLVPHVIHLREQGYDVEVACSEVGGRLSEVKEKIGYEKVHQVRLARNPAKPTNLKGLSDLKKLINTNHYDLIWTNEPVMGIMTRLAAKNARKNGTKVLYMVHGFHFYNGAPLLNWMLYYPIERIMASKADCICTVNREDYCRAQKMKVSKIEYIHGIGIDTSRLHQNGQTNIREEIGVGNNQYIVLSVGELNKNKNQQVIIRAIAVLDDNVHYVLCGKGDQREYLEKLSTKLGVNKRVHFLGYRKDVVDICSQSNVFAMPSKREGLPVASLEAMYCGLPIVNSNIRGLSDITENGVSGYVCGTNDEQGFAQGIRAIKDNPEKQIMMSERNRNAVKEYCLTNTQQEIQHLIDSMI